MMNYSDTERFHRTEILIGKENMTKITGASVLLFGLGGVGGYACEALARLGVGHLTIVDGDCFDASNINRQLGAATDTVGRPKAEVYRERIARIAPSCDVTAMQMFYGKETEDAINFSDFDVILDAIDTVSSKLLIIGKAKEKGIPVISSLGTARKLDPTRIRTGDIYETSVCPLARVMRRELRKMGVSSLRVVWSDEEPILPAGEYDRTTPIGSVSFVPSVAGMYLASEAFHSIVYGTIKA